MKRSAWILFLLAAAAPSPLRAGPELDPLRQIAIQDGGRVKPFDTFARETARRVAGARAFGFETVKGLDPVEWTLAMLVSPGQWKDEKVIRVTHAGLREAAGLPADKDRYSFNELTSHAGFLQAAGKVHEKLRQDREAKLDPVEREISTLYDSLGVMGGIFSGEAWRVVPHPSDPNATWFSLADLDQTDAAVAQRIKTLMAALVVAYRDGDRANVGTAAAALKRRLHDLSPQVYPADADLRREVHYNTLKPFRLAWGLYLIGFLLLLASLAVGRPVPGRVGLGFVVAAFAVHAYGMTIRSLISGHPPVTNMYESVIWVAWGAVLFSLIFEAVYRARYFAACASAVAVVSLILADSVPILNGSIDPLVPVLRDNMWLTIHVLTITLSYAAFFLAMAIGHVNLGLYFFAPAKKALLGTLSLFLYRCLQVGTLLCALGTMLGGWWASYSWGRFWGWDAKETSIFVALLFYVAILHARMVGLLRDFGTAVFSVLGFLGVLWAWYGVNFVLGVGLHSYGFGSGGYAYVGSFVAFELGVVAAAVIRYRRLQRSAPAPAAAGALQTAP
jgi:ABC-type transport system involved in cytochrome c biogenesis permease subunit